MSKRTAWNSTLPARTAPMKRTGFSSIAERMDVERGPKPTGKAKSKAKKAKRRGKPTTGPKPLPILMKEVDRLTARYVYATKGTACMLAGLDGHECFGGITPAHVLPRTKRHLRHDPANVIPVCQGHHDRYEKHKEWPTMVGKATGEPLYYAGLCSKLKGVKDQYGDDLRSVYETWEVRLSRALGAMAGQQAFELEAA